MEFRLLYGERVKQPCPELLHDHRCCGGGGSYSLFVLTYGIDHGTVTMGGQEVRLLSSGGKIVHPAIATWTTPA